MADRWLHFGGFVLVALATATARAEPPRLAGIVIAGEDRVAIFAGGLGEAMQVVRIGDRLGDDRVTEITAHCVTLNGPAGKTLITPGENPSTRAALAAVVAPPPPFLDPYRRERETENDQ